MGTPTIISHHLRKIASDIESAETPSLTSVRTELHKVLIAARGEAREIKLRRIASDLYHLAQDELESSMWDTEEGQAVDFAFGEAHRKTGEQDNLDGALNLLKRKVDKFIAEIKRAPGQSKDSEDSSSDITTSVRPKSEDKKKDPPGPPPLKK